MIFQGDTAFAVELLALIAATALLLYAKKSEGACKGFATGISYIAIVVSIFGMLCTGYFWMRYWEDGYFKAPNIMSHDPKMPMMGDMKSMMGNMKGMMNEKMKTMQGEDAKPEESQGSPEDHNAHH